MKFLKLLSAAFLSRKLLMSVGGLIAGWLIYWKQVHYLYSFIGQPPEIVAAYVSITRDAMLMFSAIIFSYLGINGILSWKHNTESALSQVAQNLKSEHAEKREDVQRVIHESAEKFRDDPSYRPLQPDTEETFR